MGSVKNAFHDEIEWNGLDEYERAEARALAPIEAFGRDATRLDGEATKAGNSSKPNGETNDR